MAHGEMLHKISDEIKSYLKSTEEIVVVREGGCSCLINATQILFKVVGICDLISWEEKETVPIDISPTSIKKIITGDGRADKETVAQFLPLYIGDQHYETDDESDAVAVGVAWMIQNG